MSADPHRLLSVQQHEDTCIVTMTDRTTVVFEDDGSISINVPKDSTREDPRTLPPSTHRTTSYFPASTRFVVERPSKETP